MMRLCDHSDCLTGGAAGLGVMHGFAAAPLGGSWKAPLPHAWWQGTLLIGSVLQVRPAVHLKHNGQLRLAFHELVLPSGSTFR